MCFENDNCWVFLKMHIFHVSSYSRTCFEGPPVINPPAGIIVTPKDPSMIFFDDK